MNDTPAPRYSKVAEADFPTEFGLFRIYGFEAAFDGRSEEAVVLKMGEFTSAVSTFRLDRFEVTVGRFRRFVDAYDSWRPRHPIAGEGQHPRLSSASAWQPTYDDALPQSAAALRSDISCDEMFQTWSSDSARDSLPINCVSWYAAFAFCIWDGGRLPTESEWEYAASGGNARYTYPWGDSPAPDDVDGTYAVYNCLGSGMYDCSFKGIQPVGSRPLGMARYGQLDLAGSMWEWGLDWYAPYPTVEGSNYANLENGNSWQLQAPAR